MYKPLYLLFAVVIAALPSAAWAQNQSRCQSDSLDPTQAAARLEWARKCGLLTNTDGPNSAFDNGWIDPSGNAALEYHEKDPTRAFSGNSDDYMVNYQYAHYMYLASQYYVGVQETSGPTAGYWKWTGAFKRVGGVVTPQPVRPRPLYPTFGPKDSDDIAWFPHPSLRTTPNPPWQTVDCKLY